MKALVLACIFLSGSGFATIASDLSSYSISTLPVMHLTHTVTGSDTIILAGIQARYPAPTVTGISYGGYNMDLAVSTSTGGTNAEKRGQSSLYYLVNPPTGLQSLSLTVSGSGPYKVVWVHSFAGVDQDNPIHFTITGGGIGPENPSVTISADSGDMVVAACQVSVQGIVAKTQTLTTTNLTTSTTGISINSIRRPVNNSGTWYVMAWSAPSGTAYWTAVGVSLLPKDYGDTDNPYTGTTAYQGGTWTVKVSNTNTGVTILTNPTITNTQFNVWPNGVQTVSLSNSIIGVGYIGSCTPVFGSLAITTAGATMIIPSNTKSMRYHVSGDSGATSYVYASFVSIEQAKADGGSSCGYQVYGVGATSYPLNIPCHEYDDMNLPGPVNMYWYSKGGAFLHWLQMRKQ